MVSNMQVSCGSQKALPALSAVLLSFESLYELPQLNFSVRLCEERPCVQIVHSQN